MKDIAATMTRSVFVRSKRTFIRDGQVSVEYDEWMRITPGYAHNVHFNNTMEGVTTKDYGTNLQIIYELEWKR